MTVRAIRRREVRGKRVDAAEIVGGACGVGSGISPSISHIVCLAD
jgi:hypothetical protein